MQLLSGTNVPDTVAEAKRLYSAGLYQQAYKVVQPLGALQTWQGPVARVMAGRLAAVLGGLRLGYALHLRAHREDPSDPLAAYFATRALLHLRGPLAAWHAAQRHSGDGDGGKHVRADWHAFRAELLALLRDFERAHEQMKRALDLAPERAWVHLECSLVHELEDRIDDSIHSAAHALTLHSFYRPAVQQLAHLYETADRNQEAFDLLTAASERLECGNVLMQLADYQLESGQHPHALRTIQRATDMLPLADKTVQHMLASRRSDAAYLTGDEVAAVAFARETKHPFFDRVVANLASARAADHRVVLPVGFVRQHHLTCGPATLTAISLYWNRPARQSEIAEAICYDGTSPCNERGWAEQSGFVAREFTVDWPTTTALMDLGVPFTLTTPEATSSHLQAVVGYDARRRTLLLRDPSSWSIKEMLADVGLARYRSSGPRGMLLVPPAERTRLDGLVLPDAENYDRLYELNQAIGRNDRSGAMVQYERMREESPIHFLTFQARQIIAAYDADNAAMLQSITQALVQFPGSPSLLFAKLGAMSTTDSRAARLAYLEEICGRKDSDPVFSIHLAEALVDDVRTHSRARRLLRELLKRSREARCYYALANIEWSARRFDAATELYRFAACIDDRHEFYTKQYFAASRHVKQTDSALRWLQDRAHRLTGRSSEPARSLFCAYSQLDRADEALEVLEKALQSRPQEAALHVFAADALARYGRFGPAGEALEKSRGSAHAGQWLRAAAGVANYQGRLRESLEFWQKVLEHEPQSTEAAEAITHLLAQVEGQQASDNFVRELTDRFPHNVALLRVAIGWLRGHDSAACDELIDRLLEHNPVEVWARRERGISLARQRRYQDALAELDLAILLAPGDSYGYSVRGAVAGEAGEPSRAGDDFRRALELSVDNEGAIRGLLGLCQSYAERSVALEFFYTQLVAQTTFGDGLLVYYQLARQVFPPETVLSNLRAGLTARPDLWQAWSAVFCQLSDMQLREEADELASQAAVRFPLVPIVWTHVATARRDRADFAGEIAALEKAIEINGNWAVAIYQLMDAHSRLNHLVQAKRIGEQSLARLPLDAVLHGYLADLCWRLNERDEALVWLCNAVELDPGYNWAWESLQAKAPTLQRPELALTTARQLVERRAGDARGWFWLARVLDGPDHFDEQRDAVCKALAISPRWIEAHQLHSRVLVRAGRFDEALQVCRAPVWQEHIPHEMEAQEAWVLFERGKQLDAIEQLKKIVAAHPEYWAGWQQLAGWCERVPAQLRTYLEAAQSLTRLAPGDPDSWRHVADASRAAGDRHAARLALHRALELAPNFEYVGLRLFDLEIEAHHWAAAQRAIEQLESRSANPYLWWARRVQLSVCNGDKRAALSALEKLCATLIDNDWPLTFALDQMAARRMWRYRVESVLVRFARGPNASGHVLEGLIHQLAKRRAWRAAIRELSRFSGEPPAWRRGANRLLRFLAARGSSFWLNRLVRKHGERLREDAETWAMTGHAFVNRRQRSKTIRWMSDWRTHAGVLPWMLTNVASALHDSNRGTEAAEVHEYALTLPRDQTTPDHETWLAADQAAAGDFERARCLYDKSNHAPFVPYLQCIRLIVGLTLEKAALQGEDRGRPTVFRTVFDFRRATKKHRALISSSKTLRRIYCKCIRKALEAQGHRPLAALVASLCAPL